MSNQSGILSTANLRIYEIFIIGKNGQIFTIWPTPNNLMYRSMALTESLFEASVFGKMLIRDLDSTMEQIQFSGYEQLVIKLENPDIIGSYKSLRFMIYNVTVAGDQIANNVLEESVNITDNLIEIQFCSYEHYLLTYKQFQELAGLTGADIVAKIASDPKSEEPGSIGLVNAINQHLFKTGKDSFTTQKEMYIEPTKNWIWYKQNQSLYPWAKLNRPIKAAQLMQYLAEYAVSADNPYACNFLFWQDLDRWNFRSIESLLKEPVEKVYTSSFFPMFSSTIYNLDIVSESNYLRLFEGNAFAGKYYLVEPQWDQPYREFLDFSEAHSVREITYDYFRDYKKWKHVEKYPMLDSNVNTKPTTNNIVNDAISGYFSPSYSNRENRTEWEHHGYTYSNRDGKITWQPMFDQTDLDGETCRIIQKGIKEKIKQTKIEYAQKKNLKERWKVYRCSICCDTRYRDITAIEDVIFTPEYGVVAAGSFSDMVNYDLTGITLPSKTKQFPIGLTLSYDFEKEPFNKTIGELMYLTETPDIQTKYLYDLELKRIELAKEMMQNSIKKLENLKAVVNAYPICGPNVLCNPPYDDTGVRDSDNAGNKCFCTDASKQKYLDANYNEPIRNRTEMLASQYFEKMSEIIQTEKQRFTEVYEDYRNRKAFFISKEAGFTASNSKLNLFNIKTVKRVPIRGSKYEKLATKRVMNEVLIASGITGTTADTGNFKFIGFPQGATSYYPYDVFYNNDITISPTDKHPHYDSGYNFDVGYNANPHFSYFDDYGGPDAGPLNGTDPYSVFIYYITLQAKVERKLYTTTHTLGTNDEGLPSCGNTQTQTSYSTSTSYLNKSYKDRSPANLVKEKLIRNILDEAVTNGINDLGGNYEFTVAIDGPTAVINGKSKISQCPDLYDTVVYTLTVSYSDSDVYTNNKGNRYLSQFGSGICVLAPYAIERIQDFNPLEYLNSRNFVDITPKENEKPKRPVETILEEIESFVRIEFQKPVGTNTLYDFPKGFYDTPGSEYYLPYIVMLTAGPFGRKSSDYNISVIGQDPYGFDVAVKRIKKKKQDLKPENKALVNNRDYHVLTNGYSKRNYYANNANNFGDFWYFDDRPLSYGLASRIQNQQLLYWSDSLYGYYDNFYTWRSDTDKVRLREDEYKNITAHNSNHSGYSSFGRYGLDEIFYYDLIQNSTRKNPLSLPVSYFEFSNFRVPAISYAESNDDFAYRNAYNDDFVKSFATKPEKTSGVQYSTPYNYTNLSFENDVLLYPGNVFSYHSTELAEPVPVDVNRFKSSASYYPYTTKKTSDWISLFELYTYDRNTRIEPEQEVAFYGFFYGVSAWKHPNAPSDLPVGGITAAVWKNDISGETEYGIVGPELDEEDSEFDRNFAAQFVVMSRQSIEDPCAGYYCSNPNPVDNSPCPANDPLCNCPCQDLRPDKILVGVTGSYGLTGPEPTYKELKQLEDDMKECNLIKEYLGEDWLGCVWNDPKNPLNCNCPCVGEKFLDYLRYTQTYCTFWETPPERPLLRNAQMVQIQANKAIMTINGDLTLRPGMRVRLDMDPKRYTGVWLVSSITHDFAKTKHLMKVTLIRDSEYYSPNDTAKTLKLNTLGT
jgi:hypothetical protein